MAALGAAAALVLTGITAGTASASTSVHPLTSTVTITTVSAGHMDTTSYSGAATFQAADGNGPVWAIDTLNESWAIVPADGLSDNANYTATLHVTKGSKFAEFADPGPGTNESSDPCVNSTPGGPHTGTGSVSGTIEYDISSTTPPDLTSVPSVEPANTSLGTVLSQIFDGNDSIVGGGSYTFKYSKVCGELYEQTG